MSALEVLADSVDLLDRTFNTALTLYVQALEKLADRIAVAQEHGCLGHLGDATSIGAHARAIALVQESWRHKPNASSQTKP